MINILIADDEEIIRRKLVDNIQWEKHGYRIVAVAKDGMEAYHLALQYKPEIILLDIKMPRMSGLEAAEQILKVLINTKIILLTGYDEFKYVKKAINIRVFDYLLKGEKKEKILETIDSAAIELQKKKEMVLFSQYGQDVYYQKILTNLLDMEHNMEVTKGELKEMGIDFFNVKYRILVSHLLKVGNNNFKEQPSMNISKHTKICSYCDQYLKRWGKDNYAVNYKEYMVLFLAFKEDDTDDQVLNRIRELDAALLSNYKEQLRAGVGKLCRKAADFPYSFDDAMLVLETIKDDVTLAFYDELVQFPLIKEIRDYIHQHYMEKELSLVKISEDLHFTPTYISVIFKRYSGQGFKNYLMELRMKKACELLKNTNACTYEIAESVGYPNAQYFSVSFKKSMGCSPLDYRKNAAGRN